MCGVIPIVWCFNSFVAVPLSLTRHPSMVVQWSLIAGHVFITNMPVRHRGNMDG